MKRGFLALAVAAALTGCGPDPMIGTFTFTVSGTDTQTAPSSSTAQVTGTGNLVITQGKATDYLVTIAHSDSSACTVNATRSKETPNTLSLVANQSCILRAGGAAATAILTSGTATLTPATSASASDLVTLTVNYTWSYTGLLGVNFAGTGTRTYAGTKQ